jgi:CO/xanthine dehydrogenase FAD-binding subunit
MSAPGALALCGGTDVFPAHAGRALTRPVVDLSGIADLKGIAETTDAFRFGAATSWSMIAQATLPPAFDALKSTAREVGSIQIQNRGSIGGNLCNASPAADGVPPLLALDASVELASRAGRRVLALSSFITGYRRTALRQGEIVTAIIVPKPAASATSAFVKLGARRYLVISILMAAAVIEKDEAGRIAKAAVAVGAASPVAQRLFELEQEMLGTGLGENPSARVAARHFSGLSPISDVRASDAYRREAAIALVGEALDRAAGVI